MKNRKLVPGHKAFYCDKKLNVTTELILQTLHPNHPSLQTFTEHPRANNFTTSIKKKFIVSIKIEIVLCNKKNIKQ